MCATTCVKKPSYGADALSSGPQLYCSRGHGIRHGHRGYRASALPAGVFAKPQGDSTDLASQTASFSRHAVHAPFDFASGTSPGATSVPSPEDRRNFSPVVASELLTALQAIATSSQRFADASNTLSAACARTTLPPPSMAEIPEFTGIDQDPTVWLDEMHSLACRHALTDDVTLYR
ncbi:hypothetical protein HPB51_027759 [Rhipicephalus microplus]|uniref:Uncharacterized protein n=1 Tax=Rhipicephalus microplus TaxID=6941 RepID=A0A9J6CZ76_RHIMP|nr:hypothetical protein HPB51_027759 [Rhipicephalus microplus]